MANVKNPRSTYRRDLIALGRALRELRERGGLSGNELSKKLGWAQSKVSRIETAKQLPSEADVTDWVQELGEPTRTLGEMLLLLEHARVEYRTWKENYRIAGGAGGKQRDILALESHVRWVGEFQPAFIPGFIQTAAYASELLRLPLGPTVFGANDDDIDQMVAARMERQSILYDPSKSVNIIVLEGALYSRVCETNIQIAQLDRLITLSGLPSLNLGIVPFAARLPIFPLGGFLIYDQDFVVVESLTGEQQLSSQEEVSLYVSLFEGLRDVAVSGAQATAIIQRVIESLREVNNEAHSFDLDTRHRS